MRVLPISITIALLAVILAACGGAGRTVSSRNPSRSALNTELRGNTPERGVSYDTHQSGPYRNDGDQDLVGDEDGDNREDVDNDAPWDYKPEVDENGFYHDADDASILQFGHAASTADKQAVTAVVRRYYTAGAERDGSVACGMLVPSFAYAVPLDYGRLGPAYLRGAKTCTAVMRLAFNHAHDELVKPVTVTAVRVQDGQALALLGSAGMPASYIRLQRQGSGWAVASLLGTPLS